MAYDKKYLKRITFDILIPDYKKVKKMADDAKRSVSWILRQIIHEGTK